MVIKITTEIKKEIHTFIIKQTDQFGDNGELEWESYHDLEIIDDHLSGLDEAMIVVADKINSLL